MLEKFYPLSCALFPCILYQIYTIKRSEKELSLNHLLWTYVFFVYVYMIIRITGISGFWDIGDYDRVIRLEEINLIPFAGFHLRNYILNVIMFMPLGFILPLLWKRYRKFGNVLKTAFLYSFTIELSQIFSRRMTDVDDLMMNVIGAAAGYGIYQLWIFVVKEKETKEFSNREAEAYLWLALLGEFFLYNWKLFVPG